MVQLKMNLRKHWNNSQIAISSVLGRGNVIESMHTRPTLNYWKNSYSKLLNLKLQLKD